MHVSFDESRWRLKWNVGRRRKNYVIQRLYNRKSKSIGFFIEYKTNVHTDSLMLMKLFFLCLVLLNVYVSLIEIKIDFFLQNSIWLMLGWQCWNIMVNLNTDAWWYSTCYTYSFSVSRFKRWKSELHFFHEHLFIFFLYRLNRPIRVIIVLIFVQSKVVVEC